MKYIARPSAGGLGSLSRTGAGAPTPSGRGTATPYPDRGPSESARACHLPLKGPPMSMTPVPGYRPGFAHVIQENLQELRASWYWFVLLGAALVVLGMVALICSVTTTIVTMFIVGWF